VNQPVWSSALAAQAATLRHEGKKLREIAAALGVSISSVHRWTRPDGESKAARRARLKPQAVALRRRGWSFRKIAYKLGVSWMTIYAWTREEKRT